MKSGIRLALALSLLAAPLTAPAGTLADSPLSLKGSVPPNVMFALSVEFPTAVQRAYGNAYASGTAFLGLFDNEKCYTYDTGNGWFYPSSLAPSRVCASSSEWSGNFLNWATMTGLDEFRYAMTGGHRYVDTASLTVLERTYLDDWASTGYFPNKTFTGAGATPFPSVTVVNAKKGVKMSVTGSGSDSISCTTPALASPFTCALALASTSAPVTCTTWAGDGSSSSPYQCSSFGSGYPAGATSTPQTATTFSAGTSDTVNCTSPTFSGGFDCTLARSGGAVGSCNTWSGTGSSTDPYVCTSFGNFGSNSFTSTSTAAATSTSVTVSSSTTTRVPSSGTTRISCSIINPTSSSRSISCPLSNGSTATSTEYSGNPRAFSSANSDWSITGPSGTMLSVSPYTAGAKISCGSRQCYTQYNIAFQYNATTSTTQTFYYIPQYTGTVGTTVYYNPGYDLSFAAATDYNVRVKVCDSSIGLESNCRPYGTTYKPSGVLHEHGDKMKFGVMSYYNSADIDNAVLRSKAKPVAPQKFSAGGGLVANPNTEWSSADGTHVADPDSTERTNSYPSGSNPGRSGVINYINQFGRPLDPLPATPAKRYKQYDPVGKLYYETLRYLRGIGPTTQFYTNATAATNDDFPVISSWDDPIQYACQKNYIIALGDKNTHCDKRLPGGVITSANVGAAQCSGRPEADDYGSFAESIPSGYGPSVDAGLWTNNFGNLQGDATNTRAASRTGSGSNGSWYMAGLAYWAARNDIRTDNASLPQTLGVQRVKTFVIDVEEGGASNTSQFAMAAKYGGADSFNSSGVPQNSTYNSTADHTGAAFPSYPWPKTLLRASDPQKMIDAVQSAFTSISAEIGTESALAQSSGDLRTGNGAYIFRAIFNSGGWYGDVQAFKIQPDGSIDTTADWSALSLLPAPSSRRILTFNDGRTTTGTFESTSNARVGTVFDAADSTAFNNANGNFSSRQRALLNANAGGSTDGYGWERVRYLRGEITNEGTGLGFRQRNAKLGDMVNSNPLYYALPRVGLAGNGYNTFATTLISRKPMIYVGSNDGMLHAFDASVDASGNATGTAGTELLAFVPSAVYTNLSQLTSTNYSHKYFVDGSPVISEACLANCVSGTPTWKTVLVGGLNAGGQGIYALDVTHPENFATADPDDIVLWEFNDYDDSAYDLGFTFGRPLIRKMNNGKWAAIFGNGYNNTHADGRASSTGRAYLYIVYLTGPSGTGNTWVSGTDYHKIALPSPDEPGTLPDTNGLSSVNGIDTDLDGDVDYLYAGDRKGNIWKIDVTDASAGSWVSSFLSGSTPLPLFSATDGAGTPSPQQITSGVELTLHPNGGVMVLFGTGSYIDTTDPLGPFKTDSYYGIWDKFDGTRVTSRSSLQKQKVLATVTSGADTFYFMSQCQPNYTTTVIASNQIPDPANIIDTRPAVCPADIAFSSSGQQLGWVFDLPGNGERVVSERPLLEAGILTFTTLTPASDPCAGNTEGKEYNLDYLSGGASRPLFDLNNDRAISPSDYIPVTLPGSSDPVLLPPTGRRMDGGASDTGIRFSRDPTATGTSTAGCPDFVPGWGCPSKLGPPRECGPGNYKQDVVSNEFLTSLTSGSGLISAPMKCISAPSGRMTWKQILR